jgi:hydroxymethylpyrimidine pyrophosphatase-like HAD family hydrolase
MGWVRALALDLDGTLASGDRVGPEAMAAVKQARYRGIRVLLVTGRRVADLAAAFPALLAELDAVVAENGAVLYRGGSSRPLAEPVDGDLLDVLAEQQIPVTRGDVLLALPGRYDAVVLREIGRLGLGYALVRNREALMVLPSGVSKGTGLLAALQDLGLSAHNTVAVGDAENDHALLEAAECAVAVANAVPALKTRADLVLPGPDGAGIAALVAGPLLSGHQRLRSPRRQVRVGSYPDGSATLLPSTPGTVLVTGASGRGKSYLAGLFAERLIRAGYRLLVIDPAGDHEGLAALPAVTVLRAADGWPGPAAVCRALREGRSVVADLSMVPDKLAVLDGLGPAVAALRADVGAPHWVFLEEAHEVLSAPGRLAALFDPAAGGHCLVSYRPDQIPATALSAVDLVLSATPAVDRLLATAGLPAAALPRTATGQALILRVDQAGPARPFTVDRRVTAHRRHQVKYASGRLPAGKGFRFRSGGGHLPEARSLAEFVDQLGSVDAEALAWHLAHGDVSRWFAEVVQDHRLADRIAESERELLARHRADLEDARDHIRGCILRGYLPPETHR